MATQSLYRRYRPRRFAELKGQDHIVRALRTSVAEGREGQAYLFSGPRGTGKTTTARIMAKVLNCENPQDGEPCCECVSCLSVEQGTSYDVHELDAASNNGVDAMRDLIEKASLGTPGRHKVYILDEVHMLSKGAEAALLKTLEEPPPHVVFVLATTDPQKMSDTIRSRTQHLQFHLLGPDTLQEHVRWVAADAGLTVSDEAIEQVIAQGAGSPRDTLSALELVSNAGGVAAEIIALDDYVEAMIDHDPGRGLTMIAHAVSRGRDPRTITEELIGFLRNGFLALMAPELVQLPSQRLDALTDLARRAGAAGLVRGIELLGEALTEMRHAPDPRVLLDVATVQLTAEQVERRRRCTARSDPTPRAPTRRRCSGGRGDPAGTAAAPAADPPSAAGARRSVDRANQARLRVRPRASGADRPSARRRTGRRAPERRPRAPTPPPAAAETVPVSEPDAPAPARTMRRRVRHPPRRPMAAITAADWEAVRPTLRGMARAVFSPATFVAATPGQVSLGLPNDTHRTKCEQHRPVVEQALAAHAGATDRRRAGRRRRRLGPDRTVGGEAEAAAARPWSSRRRTPDAPPSRPMPSARRSAPTMSAGSLAHDTEPQDVDRHRRADAARLSVVPAPDSAPVVNGRAIAEQARSRGPEPDPDEGLADPRRDVARRRRGRSRRSDRRAAGVGEDPGRPSGRGVPRLRADRRSVLTWRATTPLRSSC